MIRRHISDQIEKKLYKKKAIILIGARQVGKTTLVKELASKLDKSFIYLNCDEPDTRILLDRPASTQLKQIIGKKKVVIIDEGQRIPDIGLTAKLVVDQIPDTQLILTGSSSLDITSRLNEPLTGRKFEFRLYPLSFAELSDFNSLLDEKRLLEHRIVFGAYPDVINNPGEEEDILLELISSYLFKDILTLGDIKKPDTLDRLTKALALQVGSEVSLNELAATVSVDKNTVSKYLDLLEKSYITFSLNSFSRNSRRELKKSRKIYFWDNGIRNSVIKNFNPLDLRVDKGALLENYLIAERLKYLNNNNKKPHYHFWRTFQKQEIDYIEEYAGKINAYEFKWSARAKLKHSSVFIESYPNSEVRLINKDNFCDFIK